MFDVTCLDKHGNTVTNLTQWDLNQTLYIEDHGFTTAPQFHFCNKNSEKALVVQSTLVDGVLQVIVPNTLLVEPYTITVYLYLNEGDSSKTVEYVHIPVRQRPQPDSFEYEDNTVIVDVKELADEIRALNASMSTAEEARVEAENIRVSNENIRIENENARKTAETNRIDAETARVSSEATRQSNESVRESNEEERKVSENERVDAESSRVLAENTRATNENERIDAETNRTSTEAERANAEVTRAEAEVERESAEAEREANESERQTNEIARNDAETIREANEVTRQSQEEARQSNTATAISNAEKATDRANIAAEACEGIVSGTGLISSSEKGTAGGVATLDDNALIPIVQLPEIDAQTLDGLDSTAFVKTTGGKVGDGTSNYPLVVRGASDYSLIQYNDINENILGLLGMKGSDNPVFLPADKSAAHILLHSDNYSNYALPKSGGRITGGFEIQRVDSNGYFSINKNHSSTADYGTQLIDINKNGERAYIEFGANTSPRFIDKSSNTYHFLHSGNVGNYVLPLTGGAVSGDVKLIKNLNAGCHYFLPTAYDYSTGILMNLTDAGAQTMITIKITGNTYLSTEVPILSVFQFYDYTSDGDILQSSGIHYGADIGNMTVYRHGGRLYAFVQQSRSFQTFNIEVITNNRDLVNPSVSNSAMHTSDITKKVVITPKKISLSDHTHDLTSCAGTLPVAKGGTGATTLTAGAALIGNGAGTVTTRSITNMTTKGYITYNTNLMTTNTLAYWDGSYASGGASNLTYCIKGAFGDAATKAVTTSVTSGSTALITSGAVYTGLASKANTSHGHEVLSGKYTGSGGAQPPSYVGANSVRCNMMNQFTGTTVSSFGSYADVLMMNAYSWSDVPYATALAIQKINGIPKAWIAAGGNTDTWAGATEIITANNIGSQSVNYATSAGAVAWGNVSGKPSSFTPSSHNQSASTITSGTFAAGVKANATAVATLNQYQVRNISAGTAAYTAGSTALPTGDIYIQYE